jgi:hypothetical protein
MRLARARDLIHVRIDPAASADEFARKREWDIQVARVGVTPLAPTIRVGSAYPRPGVIA